MGGYKELSDTFDKFLYKELDDDWYDQRDNSLFKLTWLNEYIGMASSLKTMIRDDIKFNVNFDKNAI